MNAELAERNRLQPNRPNIAIIHWHDLGTHLSVYGKAVHSPQLQSLADQSVVFDHCFATAPLCSPARGSLWTGRYPHSHGLQGLTHRGWSYHPDEVTLPTYLEAEGYRTCLIGLQHESLDPARTGFAEILGPGITDCDTVADRAIEWLTDHSGDDAPWLLTCGTFEVHRPWPADLYEPADPNNVEVPTTLPDNEHTRQDLAAFEGAIAVADAAVGRILAALDEFGLAERTMIIFTTDHGAPFPRAKSTLYDPGVQVAMIIRPPTAWNVPAHRVDGLASHVDLVPTIVDLIGAPTPAKVQGQSLAAAVLGDDPTGRDEAFLEKTYHSEYDPIRAIRTTTHKYVVNFEDRPLLQLPTDLEDSPTRRGMGDDHLAPRPTRELYDLVADPHEEHNLIDSTEHASVRDDLDRRLFAFLRETEDPILDGPLLIPDSDVPPGDR